ncbi:MAG: B12-binding domain-containing radical SAM protein [Deltaproteobacteria bacterium]|nr:B12-binding domain-containing radical SAM protein [Deltaproteobacteria bacterium]
MVLIYPRTGIDIPGVAVFMPLSVLYLERSLLDAGFDVLVIDQRLPSLWRKELSAELERDPLFVGISAMTGAQLRWGLEAAGLVRDFRPDIPIVWGGVHPSILPQQTLADPCVDAVVIGRGEEAIVDLAERIVDLGREAVIGTVTDGRDRIPPKGERVTPRLDYGSLDWAPYVTPVVSDSRGLSHMTSRGCPHRCGYCYSKQVNCKGWRGDPATAVLDDIERLAALGESGVLFFDDNFFVNRKRVEAVARGLIDRDLKLSIKADCRADYVARFDLEFLELIKRAGFALLYIGVESGSDRVLESMHKDVTVAQTLEANRKLAEVGIRPHYSFMAGIPGEQVDDMRATVELMLRLKQEHPLAYLSPIKAFVPYPGTPMLDEAVASGFSPPSSLAEWSAFNWSSSPRPWLTRRESRFVDKAAYVTAGLDEDVLDITGLDNSGLKARTYRAWARLCRSRCAKPDLGLVPELTLVRLVRKLISA